MCTDADASSPNGDISVVITGGDDSNPDEKFSVSGQKVVTTFIPLDFETKTSYSLRLEAVDGGTTPLTGTTTVIVNVSALLVCFALY